MLLDLLAAHGVDPVPFAHHHATRLRQDGLLGWQPFEPRRGEAILTSGPVTVTSLRLDRDHLGAEALFGDGMRVSAAGDVAVVTIQGTLPDTMIVALTGRPFSAVVRCGILTDNANLIMGGAAPVGTGRTWLSVRAPRLALPDLEQRPPRGAARARRRL